MPGGPARATRLAAEQGEVDLRERLGAVRDQRDEPGEHPAPWAAPGGSPGAQQTAGIHEPLLHRHGEQGGGGAVAPRPHRRAQRRDLTGRPRDSRRHHGAAVAQHVDPDPGDLAVPRARRDHFCSPQA
ncbi:hypothetical protein [Ornithinimicrobium pekingense]|uniref:hypothetical protein n=1 Tax=Ornithinimicrobium pekingense TaxID=384677 RepID=UPI0012EC6E44|nr:hypothetical protein [Ornithinimicrobium pekingense]